MPKKLYILYIFILISFLSSCSYTRHVPEGSKILWDNEIKLDEGKSPPSTAYSILKQRPVGKFAKVVAMNLIIYNWGNGTDSSFFSKIGEAPVIYDEQKAKKGSVQLQNYFFNKGYFNATSRYATKNSRKNKRVFVEYYVDRGNRYYINAFETEISNNTLKSLYLKSKDGSYVQIGDPYDASLIEKEIDRLTEIFKNNGFYSFSKSYINYTADTNGFGDSVKLKMIISPITVRQDNKILTKPHKQYRIANVFVQTDYDYLNPNPTRDTLEHKSYIFIHDTLRYKPRYITDAIHFKKGDLFKSKNVKQSYAHLNSYGGFVLSEIDFKLNESDSTENYINAFVRLSPETKRSFITTTEATTSSGNYGINLKVGWRSRNLFKGGEELDLNLNGGIEFQTGILDAGRSQTYEVGGELGIKFPRFLLPFNTEGLLPKRMLPNSRISIYFSRVLRFEFDRETFGGRLTYNWRESSKKQYSVDFYDISYSQLFEKDNDFIASLDTFQQSAFNPALITAFRLNYTYNQQADKTKKHHHFFKGVFEMAGSSLSFFESNFSSPVENEKGVNLIGGVPYYQYIKVETDYRYYWNFSSNVSWVNRIYGGTIRPYGNSIASKDGVEVREAPFQKYLFIGGANDLRAWTSYRLGAGETNGTDYDDEGNDDNNFAIGTIKILFNSELRFPLFSFFQGAIFVDAGNIWLNGGLEDDETDFIIGDVLNQFAIGTGFGVRMDFDFFVVRFDLGIKVRDPGRISMGDPWVLDNRPFKNNTFNFALGYPF